MPVAMCQPSNAFSCSPNKMCHYCFDLSLDSLVAQGVILYCGVCECYSDANAKLVTNGVCKKCRNDEDPSAMD
jgi:hypothetical protein